VGPLKKTIPEVSKPAQRAKGTRWATFPSPVMCVNPTAALAASLAKEEAAALATTLVNGCFDERTLRPLPRYALGALALTATEQKSSDVFVLSRDHHPEGTPAGQCVSRLAVCRPVAQDELGQLAAGCAVIYTQAYSFTAEERPLTSDIPVLYSHAGTVRVSDAEREALYTATWEGDDDQGRRHEYSEVYEIWEVQRFIGLAYAK